MNKIRVRFKSVSEIIGSEDIGLLVLVDETEERQIVITCDKQMMYQFGLRVQGDVNTERLLPEVLVKVIKDLTYMHFEICITSLVDGHYTALLTNTDTLEQISIRASDAVLLSHIARLPLFIEESLWKKQSAHYQPQSERMSLPINVISNEMLQSALDKAVQEEDYETASHLRDEMKRREKLKKGDSK